MPDHRGRLADQISDRTDRLHELPRSLVGCERRDLVRIASAGTESAKRVERFFDAVIGEPPERPAVVRGGGGIFNAPIDNGPPNGPLTLQNRRQLMNRVVVERPSEGRAVLPSQDD
jgi:hypothetical protein